MSSKSQATRGAFRPPGSKYRPPEADLRNALTEIGWRVQKQIAIIGHVTPPLLAKLEGLVGKAKAETLITRLKAARA